MARANAELEKFHRARAPRGEIPGPSAKPQWIRNRDAASRPCIFAPNSARCGVYLMADALIAARPSFSHTRRADALAVVLGSRLGRGSFSALRRTFRKRGDRRASPSWSLSSRKRSYVSRQCSSSGSLPRRRAREKSCMVTLASGRRRLLPVALPQLVDQRGADPLDQRGLVAREGRGSLRRWLRHERVEDLAHRGLALAGLRREAVGDLTQGICQSCGAAATCSCAGRSPSACSAAGSAAASVDG